MKNRLIQVTKYSIIGLTGVLIFSGCTAGSAPKPTNMKSFVQEFKVDANDRVNVTVSTSEDVNITENAKQRIGQKIETEVNALKLKNTYAGKVNTYQLAVNVTKYDEGNAFARALLAGLGQMHIDADTNVLLLPNKTKVAEFSLDKTFAWGGIYGASTTIESVEDGFAKGIAEAVTATKEEGKK